MIVVCFIGCLGFIVFYLFNPFIWSDPINKFYQMTIYRNLTIADQQNELYNHPLLSLTDKIQHIYKNFLAVDSFYPTLSSKGIFFLSIDLIFIIIGSYYFYQDIRCKKDKSLIFKMNKVILILWCLVVGGITAILIPLDWDRYYLPILVCVIFFEAKGVCLLIDSVSYYFKHYDKQ